MHEIYKKCKECKDSCSECFHPCVCDCVCVCYLLTATVTMVEIVSRLTVRPKAAKLKDIVSQVFASKMQNAQLEF